MPARGIAQWVIRIVPGVALLFALKIPVDFFHSEYFEDNVPPVREWSGLLLHPADHSPDARVVAFIVFVWAFLFCAYAILVYEYILSFFARRRRLALYVWLRRVVVT